MIVDEQLANGIADDINREGLRNLAMSAGFRSIESVARRRILSGQTTTEEILRVVGIGPAP